MNVATRVVQKAGFRCGDGLAIAGIVVVAHARRSHKGAAQQDQDEELHSE